MSIPGILIANEGVRGNTRMHSVVTCAVVVAYLASVCAALEFSHRLYWHLSKRTTQMRVSPGPLTVLTATTACIPLAAALLVTAAFAFFISHHPLECLGLSFNSRAGLDAARGLLVALGCVVMAFLIGVLARRIKVNGIRLPSLTKSKMPSFSEGTMILLGGAIFEELIFRGYIYCVLSEGFGPATAVAASSVLFSLAHLIKHRNVPALFTINAFLFGLVAALCRHFTGSLWLPIGLHFGWNVVSGSILGLPYSGRTYEGGLVSCNVSGPAWLTGGLHSLDAGVLGTIALLVAGIGLLAFVPFH